MKIKTINGVDYIRIATYKSKKRKRIEVYGKIREIKEGAKERPEGVKKSPDTANLLSPERYC